MDQAPERWLTTKEVAERLGVREATVRDWRFRRVGPRGVSLGRRTLRYPESEVERWLASKREQEAARDGAA